MVKAAGLQRKLRAAPKVVRAEVTLTLQKEAEKVVKFMQVLAPPELRNDINWTWGEAPPGAVTIGTVRGNDIDRIAITIYSKSPRGYPTQLHRWFEFGTGPRYQKSGKYTGMMPASPYFYPAWRAEKKRVRSAITRAVRRGLKKL